jgi:hypothetical protein
LQLFSHVRGGIILPPLLFCPASGGLLREQGFAENLGGSDEISGKLFTATNHLIASFGTVQ